LFKFGALSKETISNSKRYYKSLKDAYMMFSSSDYYTAFSDEHGFGMM
jgi:hypothetical protein